MSTGTDTGLQVVRTELNPCTLSLEITCDESTVKEGRKRALKAAGKDMRLPGFRPGQAPIHVVEKTVNPEWLKSASQEETVNIAFKKALKQEEIEPAGSPALEELDFDLEAQTCRFKLKVPLPPKVELADYKGLSAQMQSTEVADDEIGHFIEQLRQQEQKREAVTDRGIVIGDIAVVNLKEQDAEGEGRTFMVIAGETFPDLDQALQGMEAEQIKSVELDFPESFQEQDWAGKMKKATLTVRSVAAVKLPEIEELAKSHDLESEDELRKRVKERLEEVRLQQAHEMLNEDLLDQLLSNSTVEVADTTWESVVNRRVGEIKKELEEKGQTLEAYAEANNMTVDEFLEKQKAEAKLHVKRAVVVERIFKNEEMQISGQEANYHFAQIAIENKVPKEEVKKFAKEFGPQIRDEIVFRAMFGNVMRFLREHGKITDAKGEPMELGKEEDTPLPEAEVDADLGQEIVSSEPATEETD